MFDELQSDLCVQGSYDLMRSQYPRHDKLKHIRQKTYLDNLRSPTRIGLRLRRHGDVAEWLKAAVC